MNERMCIARKRSCLRIGFWVTPRFSRQETRNQKRDLRTCGQKGKRKTERVHILDVKKSIQRRQNDQLFQILLMR